MKRKHHKLAGECGAVVIEATLSVTFFMFVIVVMLNFVNICIAQAKIGISLNQTAKEISQYTYFYSLTGLNEIQATLNEETETVKSDITKAEDAVFATLNSVVGMASGVNEPSEVVTTVENSMEAMEEVAENIANATDKKAWVMSVLKIMGNEGYEALKGLLGGALTKGLMQKNLFLEEGINADSYLKALGVYKGVEGLNTYNSAIFLNGTDDIQLICKYKLKIIELLNHEYSFSIVQTAHTKAWGAKAMAGPDSDYDPSEAASGKFINVGAGEGELFGEYASKTRADGDYVDVIIHASGSSMQVMVNGTWEPFTPAQLDDWLNERGYDGSPIRLISCGTGSETSKVAQEVATQLNVTVKAPTDTVWAYPNGRLVVGPDAATDTGDWKIFEPKTEVK